jgi:RNA 3'-terminal phosphate cyclase
VAALACADLVAWGTIEARERVTDGLDVTLDVDEWVHPTTGGGRVTFTADDPAENVGAPEWDPSEQRVLVVVSDVAPAEWHAAAEGERAVKQWRDAGSPRLADEECQAA